MTNLPTGMAEVVTAVAWEECDAIVMVTIVLLVIWVCGTVPKHEQDRIINICAKKEFPICSFIFFIQTFVTSLQILIDKKPVPIVVVDGTVLVATIGATVAAATGVTGLKMGFCGQQNIFISVTVLRGYSLLLQAAIKKQ